MRCLNHSVWYTLLISVYWVKNRLLFVNSIKLKTFIMRVISCLSLFDYLSIWLSNHCWYEIEQWGLINMHQNYDMHEYVKSQGAKKNESNKVLSIKTYFWLLCPWRMPNIAISTFVFYSANERCFDHLLILFLKKSFASVKGIEKEFTISKFVSI